MKPFSLPRGLLHPRHWSLATQLTLLVISIMASTLFVLNFSAYRTARAALVTQIGTNFEAQATSASDVVATFLFGNVSELQTLALSETLERALIARNTTYAGAPAEIEAEILALDRQWAASPDNSPFVTSITSASAGANRIVAQLLAFLGSYEEHTELFVTDRYGATVGATGRLSDYYHADETWWQAAWNNGQGAVYVSQPVYDQSANVTALLIAVPVYDHVNGQVVGILRSTLLVVELLELLDRQLVGQTGHVDVLTRSGELVFKAGTQHEEEFSLFLRARLRNGQAGRAVAPNTQGEELNFGYAPITEQSLSFEGGGAAGVSRAEAAIAEGIGDLDWVLVISQESSEAFATLERVAQRNNYYALVIAAATTILTYFLAQLLTRPLVRLSAAAEEVGAGRLDVPLPATGSDEINRLSASFAQMVAKLRLAFATLEQRVRERTAELATANNQLQTEVLERKQAQADLSRRNQYLAALQETALDLLRQRNLDDLLNELVRRAAAMLDCEHGYLFIIDSSKNQMIQAAGIGLARSHIGQWRKLGVGIAGQAWEQNKTLVVDDYQQWVDRLPNFPFYRAIVAMPLHVASETVGVIGLAHSLPDRTFTGEELALLQQFGTMAAVALENARLLATIQQELAERRKVEETLRASEARNRAMINAVPDLLFRLDNQGTFVDYAAQSESLLLIPPSVFLNRTIHDLFPSPLSDNMMTCVHQAIATNEVQLLEYQLPTENGYNDFEARFIVSGDNELLVIVRNITARKQIEAQLRRAEARYRTLVEQVPAVVYLDVFEAGRPHFSSYVSPQVESILGYTPEEFYARPSLPVDILHPEDRDESLARDQEHYQTGHKSIQEYRVVSRDGRVVWLRDEAVIIHDETGRPLGSQGILLDITERKQVEESMRYARDQALEASRLKSELLAKVSHELRTPLGAIMGYAEMLQEGIFGPLFIEQREATAEIIDSSHFLTTMVNELLDQAQLEAGRVKLNVKKMAPADLLEQVKSKLDVLAQARGLALNCEVDPAVPATLCGDPERLQQILINLVGNAIKFTEHGSVSVHLYRPDDTHWAMRVADTGAGIPPEAKAYIFEPFRQVDSTLTRLHRGTGLGLSIVKQLVTLMDGQITLESELGRGSTFTTTLPLVLSEEQPNLLSSPEFP
jgi:PAS domain S-box-containing protein